MKKVSSFFRTGLLLQSLILTLLHQGYEALTYDRSIKGFCSGGDYNCALFDDGRVKCVGRGDTLGMSASYGATPNTIGDFIPYVNITTSQYIEEIYCGAYHLCATLSNGKLKCIGNNYSGQLGLGISTSTVGEVNGYTGDNLPFANVGTGLNVTGVALGYFHTCVLVTGNKVKCYGSTFDDQLGYSNTTDKGRSPSHMGDNLPFVDLGTDVEVVSIHSGNQVNHNCVILSAPSASAQRIKCWGRNSEYELGYGDTNNRGGNPGGMGDNLPLVDLGTESRVQQITLGSGYSCTLLINDILKCWGKGANGQLGSGSSGYMTSTGNALPSVLIDTGKTIKFVAAGGSHTCIVYDDMLTMKCFGLNDKGQLGQGNQWQMGDLPMTLIPNIPAIDLGTGSLSISNIYGGWYFSCVVFVDSSTKCFGDNSYGQFGNGSSLDVGDQSGEMGSNLQSIQFFSPTKSPTPPTLLPTKNPSSPTLSPTKNPSSTHSPTKNPTLPTLSPTKNPTIPTHSPTNTPTTSKPTTNIPTNLSTSKPSSSNSQSNCHSSTSTLFMIGTLALNYMITTI